MDNKKERKKELEMDWKKRGKCYYKERNSKEKGKEELELILTGKEKE